MEDRIDLIVPLMQGFNDYVRLRTANFPGQPSDAQMTKIRNEFLGGLSGVFEAVRRGFKVASGPDVAKLMDKEKKPPLKRKKVLPAPASPSPKRHRPVMLTDDERESDGAVLPKKKRVVVNHFVKHFIDDEAGEDRRPSRVIDASGTEGESDVDSQGNLIGLIDD